MTVCKLASFCKQFALDVCTADQNVYILINLNILNGHVVKSLYM